MCRDGPNECVACPSCSACRAVIGGSKAPALPLLLGYAPDPAPALGIACVKPSLRHLWDCVARRFAWRFTLRAVGRRSWTRQPNPHGKARSTPVAETSRSCTASQVQGWEDLRARRDFLNRHTGTNGLGCRVLAGVLVGTLGVAGYRDAMQRVRQAAHQAGKKTYTLLMGKPSPAKLANFPEIEVIRAERQSRAQHPHLSGVAVTDNVVGRSCKTHRVEHWTAWQESRQPFAVVPLPHKMPLPRSSMPDRLHHFSSPMPYRFVRVCTTRPQTLFIAEDTTYCGSGGGSNTLFCIPSPPHPYHQHHQPAVLPGVWLPTKKGSGRMHVPHAGIRDDC